MLRGSNQNKVWQRVEYWNGLLDLNTIDLRDILIFFECQLGQVQLI